MKKLLLLIGNTHKTWFVVVILAIALLFRLNRFAEFPVGGETKDEYAWSFLGASLLQTGRPASWSHFPQYQPFVTITIGADEFPLVSPALDHPPLFSLIPGFAHAMTGSWMETPSLKVIRFPMVLLGVVNVGLLFLALRRWQLPVFTQYVATIIYASAPTFVFSSRLVVAENLLITWTLIALFLLAKLPKKLTRWQVVSLMLVGVFAVLTKMSGVVIPVGILLYGLTQRSKSLIVAGAVGGLLGFVVFGVYGVFYDASLFSQVFFAQSQRLLGLATLHNRFFLHPTIVGKIFIDGWVVLGLMSFCMYAKAQKIASPIVIFGLLNLLFIGATVGQDTFHGWYNFPFFPIFAFTTAWLVAEVIHSQNFWLFWLLWLFILPSIRLGFIYSESELSVNGVRILMALGGLPIVLQWLKPKSSLNWLILSLCGVLLVANSVAVWKITAQKYWEDDAYFLPPVVIK